jgi:hypothetical protein
VNANSVVRVKVEGGGDQVVAHVGLHALGAFADRLGLGHSLSSRILIDSGGFTGRAFGYRPTEVSIAGQRLSGIAICLFVPSASIAVQGPTLRMVTRSGFRQDRPAWF